MKTIWTNDLTGTHYSDYDRAANSVLEHARYIEGDVIREVLEEHTPHEILDAMGDLIKGTILYNEIMEKVILRILSEYLIESEVPDEEYDFIMEGEEDESI